MIPMLHPTWFTRKFFRMFGSLNCCFVFNFFIVVSALCNLPAHFHGCPLPNTDQCVSNVVPVSLLWGIWLCDLCFYVSYMLDLFWDCRCYVLTIDPCDSTG